LKPKQFGVHPSNRDGEGFVFGRAISRGVKMLTTGYSKKTFAQDAYCLEDHPINRHIAKFSVNQNMLYPGMAKFNESEIRVGPGGGTHANHFKCMVLDESPCDHPRIAEFGKLSQRKCFADKAFHDACVKGDKWKMFRWPVEACFPIIPTIIQQARNAVSQIAEGACCACTFSCSIV